MKFLAYISLYTALVFPGVLDMYGTGERTLYISSSGMGLGESYFFSGYRNQFNSSFIASHWKSDLTHINISTKFNTNIGGYSDKDINVSSFSFTFPFLKNKTLSFGLHPFSRSDVEIIERDGYNYGQDISHFIEDPMNSVSYYKVYGGISSIYSALSIKLNKLLSMGFKVNSLFGNQFQTNRILLSDFDFSLDEDNYTVNAQDSIYHIQFNKFSGYSLQMDYLLDALNHQIAFSTSFMGPLNVDSRSYYDLYKIYDPVERYTLNDYEFLEINSGNDLLVYEPYYEYSSFEDVSLGDLFKRINDISIGYSYNMRNSGILMEFRKYNQVFSSSIQDSNIKILGNNNPVFESLHFGYYANLVYSQVGFLNSITLRSGAYYKKIDFGLDGGADSGFTLGAGFSINNNSDLIDIGIKFGKLNHDTLDNEKYIKAYLSIDIGEKWFHKIGEKN